MIPVPDLSTELGPIIVSSMTATYPSKVVQTAATTEEFTTGMGLLNTSILRTIDHGHLEAPVILAVAKLHGTGRGRDHVNVTSVAVQHLVTPAGTLVQSPTWVLLRAPQP